MIDKREIEIGFEIVDRFGSDDVIDGTADNSIMSKIALEILVEYLEVDYISIKYES